MKKTVLYALAIAISTLFIFNSCKKEELGTVKLDPATKTVSFDEVYQIKPEFSPSGTARNKTYVWKSDADSIASVKASMYGGTGEVTPRRIGEATITYTSTDGLVSATSKVIVAPRSNILNGIYFKKGVSATEIMNNVSGIFTFSADESTATHKVYNAPTSATVQKLIYELDSSGNLTALWVIIKDTTSNRTSAEHYILERFNATGRTQNSITFYRNTGLTAFPINTVLGMFLNVTLNGVDYTFGVKIMDASSL